MCMPFCCDDCIYFNISTPSETWLTEGELNFEQSVPRLNIVLKILNTMYI